MQWLPAPDGVVAYRRDGVAHLANLTDAAVVVDVGVGWSLAHATGPCDLDGAGIHLAPRSGAMLERR